MSFAISAGCREVPRTYSTHDDGGTEIFRDDFNRDEIGDHWHSESDAYSLDGGSLRLHGPRNHPLWLDVKLPDDVRIEFDAWSTSDEGDIKAPGRARPRPQEGLRAQGRAGPSLPLRGHPYRARRGG